jgi:hypothetical protein
MFMVPPAKGKQGNLPRLPHQSCKGHWSRNNLKLLGEDQKEAGHVRDTDDRRRRNTMFHRTLWWDSGAELESDIDFRCDRRDFHVMAGHDASHKGVYARLRRAMDAHKRAHVCAHTRSNIAVLMEMLKDRALERERRLAGAAGSGAMLESNRPR